MGSTLKEVAERMDELGEEDRKEFLIWLKEILAKTFPGERDIERVMQNLQERRKGHMVYVFERIYKDMIMKEREENLLLFTNLKKQGKEELYIQALQNDDIREELCQKFDIQ